MIFSLTFRFHTKKKYAAILKKLNNTGCLKLNIYAVAKSFK